MTRRLASTVLALLLAVGVSGLAGCGDEADGGAAMGGAAEGAARSAVEEVAVDVVAAMGADGQALAALGFDPADIAAAELAAPSPTPTGSAAEAGAPTATGTPVATGAPAETAGPKRRDERGDGWRKRHRARVLMRRNTLHGEVVVRTEDGGTKTVAVQRGTVTAIDDDSMTVKSTDGFTMTWRFGDKLRVVERRGTVQPKDVAVGAPVGVSGTRDGAEGVARLVVLAGRK